MSVMPSSGIDRDSLEANSHSSPRLAPDDACDPSAAQNHEKLTRIKACRSVRLDGPIFEIYRDLQHGARVPYSYYGYMTPLRGKFR